MPTALMYHDLVPEGQEDASGFPGFDAALYKVTPVQFQAHLKAIAKVQDRNPASIQDSLAITFDDGGASALDVVDVLERHGLKGYFFITVNKIGAHGFLDRVGIRALHARGHTVGSHSCSHPLRMAHLPFARILDEWSVSRNKLSEIVGEEVFTASVPGGDFSPDVSQAAAEAGYRLLFTSEPTRQIQREGNLVISGRYTIRSWTSPRTVAALARGSWSAGARQAFSWKIKKICKQLAGDRYLDWRQRLLARNSHVRWGDLPK
jgi:peptidoglycan/xylan/chitin deacetylase (PgdA/CDA1 family)